MSYGLLLAMVGFVLMTYDQHGISNDEIVQHTYGRLLLDFYGSLFQNEAAFHYKNLYLYGGLFDLLAAMLERISDLWLWDLRHLLCSIFGLLGLIACYKIGRFLGGERTGFLALLILILTAPWTGAMFTHTKDVPFATCMLFALYYTIKAMYQLPAVSRAVVVKLGVAIGCALGMRIGGVFAIIYLFITLAFALNMHHYPLADRLRLTVRATSVLLPSALIAYALMAVFWPWGVSNPGHPFVAIKAFSHFSFNMQTIVNGAVYNIGDVPRTYLLHYLLVKLPEMAWLGWLLLLVHAVLYRKIWYAVPLSQRIAFVAVLVTVLFPLGFVLYDKPALYNGVRHFTFILPSLVILAAYGLHLTFQTLEGRPVVRSSFLVSLLVLGGSTAHDFYVLHPYEYVDYNHFAGNALEAQSRWEGDYWSSAIRQASRGLVHMSLPRRDQPYKVAVCAESEQGAAYLDDRFLVTKNWERADFFISTTNMHCDDVLKGDVITQVSRGGMVLAVVKDRRELRGAERLAQPPVIDR